MVRVQCREDSETNTSYPLLMRTRLLDKWSNQDRMLMIKLCYTSRTKYLNLLLEDGHLNRETLGKWVFSHKEDLQALNGITHPAIRYAMFKEIGYYYLKGYRMCVLDVPLLFEGNLDSICGVTVSVICTQELQLERLMTRNPELSEEDAKNRLKSQMSAEERMARSDYILQNNSTLVDLYEQIESVVKKSNLVN